MRVHWTDNAISHLANIYEYISLNSLIYAIRMVEKLTRRSSKLPIIHYPVE
jgi:toxin ParE1/3/4